MVGDTPVLVAGDALFTAHYRLGIGINSGFSYMRELSQTLGRLAEAGRDVSLRAEAVARHAAAAGARLRELVQLQLSTMFYESVCDMIVFFDMEARRLVDSQVVYARDGARRSSHAVRDAAELHRLCGREIAAFGGRG